VDLRVDDTGELGGVLAFVIAAAWARRGYFVEGLGGAQFALPAAIERLAALGVDGVRARTFHASALQQLHYFGHGPGGVLPSKALMLRHIANALPRPYRFRPAADLATDQRPDDAFSITYDFEPLAEPLEIHVVSDSTGETAAKLAEAANESARAFRALRLLLRVQRIALPPPTSVLVLGMRGGSARARWSRPARRMVSSHPA
jgi:hypothetical protein